MSIRQRHAPAAGSGLAAAPAWLAVMVLFAFDGFVFGTWAARVPDIATQVGASHAALGGALLCVSFGALATMQLAGRWSARYGGGAVASAAALLLSIALVLPGFATSIGSLAAALCVFGAATGAVNVAANSLGVRLEAQHARSLMPMLHAGVSFGALAGAVLGGVAATALTVLPHLLLVAGLGLLVTFGTARSLARVDPLPGGERRMKHKRKARSGSRSAAPLAEGTVSHRGLVVMLGVIAGCTAFAEGTLTDWAALHVRTDLAAGPIAASAAFAGFSLAMGAGRLLGGWGIRRFGETRLLVIGALTAAVAMLAAALTDSVPVALVSFFIVGLGLSNIFPIAVASSGAVAGPRGVALASTVGYTGLLGGPPLVGFVSEHVGLPLALTSVSFFAALVAVIVWAVRKMAAARSLALFPAAADPLSPRSFRFVDTVGQLFRAHASDLQLLVQRAS